MIIELKKDHNIQTLNTYIINLNKLINNQLIYNNSKLAIKRKRHKKKKECIHIND